MGVLLEWGGGEKSKGSCGVRDVYGSFWGVRSCAKGGIVRLRNQDNREGKGRPWTQGKIQPSSIEISLLKGSGYGSKPAKFGTILEAEEIKEEDQGRIEGAKNY